MVISSEIFQCAINPSVNHAIEDKEGVGDFLLRRTYTHRVRACSKGH